MAILWGIIGVLFVIVLLLRIGKMTGAVTTTVKTVHGSYDQDGKFHPGELAGSGVVPLPVRSPVELQQQAASMPVEWISYPGMTPPLKLQIRGTSQEMYRRVCRKYIDQFGQDNFAQLPKDQMHAVMCSIKAEAYVLDWDGAQYPNGAAMPFSPSNLAILLGNDPFLDTFLSEQVERISPKWNL